MTGRPVTRRRPRSLWLLLAMIVLVGGFSGFAGGASADTARDGFEELNDCWDDDALPVRNLTKVSEVTKRNRTTVKMTWEPPADSGLFQEYRIAYTADWRPQKFVVLTTDKTAATVSGLWPGRTYTIYVQPTGSPTECNVGIDSIVGDAWGTPAAVTVTTADTRTYQSDSPWVVSLGDSFISGEGGRWAGNSDLYPNLRKGTDTGERAYYDYASGEEIAGCHRSRAALIHITVAKSMNFACSGAITASAYDSRISTSTSGEDPEKWKPGIDRKTFPNVDLTFEGQEAIGQAEMLARFARTHRVEMVVLSIGGNNFYFSDIVTNCVTGYLGFSRCSEDERLAHYISEEWQDKVRAEVKGAIQEIVWAMRDAGYDESEWTLVQNFYPQPIATSDQMRYADDALAYRQQLGGCGFRDVDADWAVNSVLPTVNATVAEAALEARAYFDQRLRLVQMDTSQAFRGHELCNEAVKRVDSYNAEDRGGVKSWRKRNAPDKSEWMKDIDISNFSATEKNESFHPNYWGQLALRNCLRQLWNGGDIVSGGTCTPLQGRNRYLEPNMEFTRVDELTHLGT